MPEAWALGDHHFKTYCCMFLFLFAFCLSTTYTQIDCLNRNLDRGFYINKKKVVKRSSTSSVDNKTPATSLGSYMLKGQGALELYTQKHQTGGKRT
jgi:hypothetical protein